MTSVRAAAFMDVDRTLLRGSSLLALVGPMSRAGLLSRRLVVRAAAQQVRFAALGASEARLRRATRRATATVAGMDAGRVREVTRLAVPTHLAPRFHPDALSAIEAHRDAGEGVYLVSSAPEEVVEPLAGLLGVDGFAASRVEVVDGRFTGRVLRMVQGEEKARAVEEIAAARGLELARCTAYGDSVTDAPMLAAVGRAVCVNPDARLRALAVRHGWEVREFEAPVVDTLWTRLWTARGRRRAAPPAVTSGDAPR